jgi:hypothetical protein
VLRLERKYGELAVARAFQAIDAPIDR